MQHIRGCRPPIGVPKMLRMYCLQQWYGLADEALEDALYDSQALRDFVGIDLSRESVPDATTLLKFRRLLQDNDLTRALFDEINVHLSEQGLLMRAGTIVDATIIAAPSSTKNEGKTRDPEMHQTKKGNQWHFGMKAHIGVDAESGLVHTVVGKRFDGLGLSCRDEPRCLSGRRPKTAITASRRGPSQHGCADVEFDALTILAIGDRDDDAVQRLVCRGWGADVPDHDSRGDGDGLLRKIDGGCVETGLHGCCSGLSVAVELSHGVLRSLAVAGGAVGGADEGRLSAPVGGVVAAAGFLPLLLTALRSRIGGLVLLDEPAGHAADQGDGAVGGGHGRSHGGDGGRRGHRLSRTRRGGTTRWPRPRCPC